MLDVWVKMKVKVVMEVVDVEDKGVFGEVE